MSEVSWSEDGLARAAGWRDEYGAPPRRVIIADDTLTADAAFRAATQGAALLWRGDYHNGRQLLQAMGRRVDAGAGSGRRRPRALGAGSQPTTRAAAGQMPAGGKTQDGGRDNRGHTGPDAEGRKPATLDAGAFNQHRLRQSQRSQILNRLLVELTVPDGEGKDGGFVLDLRRAPDIDQACRAALGLVATPLLLPLRALLGFIGAWEWRQRGVTIPGMDGRIHVHYGVFSPNRGEYLDLLARAPLPADRSLAFDIGTGSGVLAALLASRGIEHVIATDQDDRALACARENIAQLSLQSRIDVLKTDLFPEGRSPLVVCNPPWLPARPTTAIEHALYDPDSRMLTGFLQGLPAHLAKGGEGWLIMSDLAEHLGLREPGFIPSAVAAAGLRVLGKLDIKPRHPKAADETDPFHAARRAETTSLWRLGLADQVS